MRDLARAATRPLKGALSLAILYTSDTNNSILETLME